MLGAGSGVFRSLQWRHGFWVTGAPGALHPPFFGCLMFRKLFWGPAAGWAEARAALVSDPGMRLTVGERPLRAAFVVPLCTEHWFDPVFKNTRSPHEQLVFASFQDSTQPLLDVLGRGRNLQSLLETGLIPASQEIRTPVAPGRCRALSSSASFQPLSPASVRPQTRFHMAESD